MRDAAVAGGRLLAELPNFAAVNSVGDRPPTQFSISCTAAELARDRVQIERSLELLARGGHSVVIEAIALPNFSAVQLERLGVDLTAAEAVAAISNLLELETRWHGTLSHRAHGGFGSLRFTPEATVVDIAINQRIVRALGLTAELGSHLPAEPPNLDPDPDLAEHVRVIGDAQLCERCEQASDVAVRRRLKPIRRPTMSEADVPAQLAELARRFGSQLTIASTPHHPDEPSVDLIYGVDEADVHEFVELARRSQLPDEAEARDAINRRIGALLGYPPCCVEAFIRASSSEEDVTERTLLARRLGAGVLDPRWPLLLLVYEHYLPCSLHCERSLARADELEAALAEAGVAPPVGGWGRIVFLADLERQGNVAVLLRESDEPHGFRYRLIALNHRADVLAPLQLGDRLEIGPQTTTVLRGEQVLHVYAGQVGLFDVAREWGDSAWFQAYFRAQLAVWAHALALVERAQAAELAQAAEQERAPEQERAAEQQLPFVEQVHAAIERLCEPGLVVRACEAGRAGASEVEWIRARLDGDAGSFVLTIVPRQLDGSSGSSDDASGVAARFDPSGKLVAQHRLVRSLAEQLDVRATVPTPDTVAAKLLELVRQATMPDSGEFQTFAGFAACWPICERSGSVRLALVAHGEVLELIIAPRAGRETWPGKSSRCAIGYPSDSPLRSDRARAAFARFVQRLRLVDRA